LLEEAALSWVVGLMKAELTVFALALF